jgi:peptidoglycan DL-endopeptidase LytE
MKCFRLILIVVVFINSSVFSQENFTKHTIKKGETITSIAHAYMIKPNDIYKYNPKAHKILKLHSTLLIPILHVEETKKEDQTVTYSSEISHEVLAKETGYGISKQYGITIEELNKANPLLESEGLKIGQIIKIPKKIDPNTAIQAISQPKAAVQEINEVIVREVLPKETKYAIAKQYGITIQELERQNPEIENGLPVGYKLNIYKAGTIIPVNPVLNEKDILSGEINPSNVVKDSIIADKPVLNSNLLDQLVINASENIGTRYRIGGTTKAGFDCSGLMVATFGNLDIKLPRTSREQSNFGIKIDATYAQKGDLIFFSTNRRGNINHVGMVVDVIGDEIKFIHASIHSGVIISSTKESYYAKDFRQINRVVVE